MKSLGIVNNNSVCPMCGKYISEVPKIYLEHIINCFSLKNANKSHEVKK